VRELSASEFKATCLAVIDDVAAGEEVVITKRGKPVARLVPLAASRAMPLAGTLVYDDPDDLLAPIGERWNAEG
jgi:prevent-host-death family protein